MILSDRPLPHAPEAERALLSCVMQDRVVMSDALASLTADDFYIPIHRAVFAQIAKRQNADIVHLAEHLDSPTAYDDLMGIYQAAVTVTKAEEYLATVTNLGNSRRVLKLFADASNEIFDAKPSDLVDVLADIERRTLEQTRVSSSKDAYRLSDTLLEAVKGIEALHSKDVSRLGIPTGFHNIDEVLMGLRRGEMTVIAARPSIGKTTLAVNILCNMAARIPVAFYSLEMNRQELAKRCIFADSRINPKAVYQGTLSAAQWFSDIGQSVSRLQGLDLYIVDQPSMSAMEIKASARRLTARYNIQAIAVDYLQIVKPAKGNKNYNREQEVAGMSSDFKALARELEIPVIVLAQLNREAEGNKAPKLSSLRESGAIEQDADVVAFLHRERETDSQEASAAVSQGQPIDAELVIAKHRNGATGVAHLEFYPGQTRFADRSRINDNDVPRTDKW